jgi:TRAP-type C4-dicarboxylate transport system permease small subunit
MSEGLPVRDEMPADAVGRVLEMLARASAIFGGLVLTAAMVMTVLSVIGRALLNVAGGIPGFGWMGPVPGDYEIVELAAAVGVAAFLPICQMRGGHVLVDMFFAGSGPRVLSGFSALGNLLFAVAGGVIVWRLYLGTISKFQYQESSMVLQIPVGWGYLGLTVFFALAVLCAIYLFVRNVAAMSQTGADPAR